MEIWKDIIRFKGEYQVSNIGRIRSVEKLITKSNGKTYTRKSKILKSQPRMGYERIRISIMKKKYTLVVHREVAMVFIPNPTNKSQVNHINEIKNDNRVINLEWSTPSENVRHSFSRGVRKVDKGKNKPKPVLNTRTGIYYKSLRDASKTITNISYSGLQHQMNGVVKNTTGLIYA